MPYMHPGTHAQRGVHKGLFERTGLLGASPAYSLSCDLQATQPPQTLTSAEAPEFAYVSH